jgi:hypothetical protein
MRLVGACALLAMLATLVWCQGGGNRCKSDAECIGGQLCFDGTCKLVNPPTIDLAQTLDLSSNPQQDLAGAPYRSGLINGFGYSLQLNGHPFAGGDVGVAFSTETWKPGTSCLLTTLANCKLFECRGDLQNGVTFTTDNAGTVVWNNQTSGAQLTLADISGTFYAPTNDLASTPANSPLFSAGDKIAVTAGSQPAVNLVAPAEPTITAPPFPPWSLLSNPSPTPFPVSSSTDLVVTTNGGTRKLHGIVTVFDGNNHSQELDCYDGANSLTIPSSVLQSLVKGPVSFSLTALDYANITVDGHDTAVQVGTDVLQSDGTAWGGVALQIM